MSHHILIVDDVHPILMEKLRNAGIAIDYRPDCTREDAEAIIGGFDGLVIRSKFFVDETFLSKSKRLKLIGRPGAGLDNIDEEAAKKLNIDIIGANEGNCDAVAEHMVGMLLSLINNMNRANRQIHARQWLREANRGYELKGRTVALIGYGHNGQAMAKKLSGFDVRVIAYDKYRTGFSDDYVSEVSMEEIVKQADILSFHIPLTRETKGMVDKEYLFHFRKPIFFLMGARGEIVDIPAVLHYLDLGKILGAAFDVLPVEKFPALSEQTWFDNLIQRDNVLLTPHVAGWTFESYFKLSDILADKMLPFIANW